MTLVRFVLTRVRFLVQLARLPRGYRAFPPPFHGHRYRCPKYANAGSEVFCYDKNIIPFDLTGLLSPG